MDLDALARQYGGSVAPATPTPPVADLDALAQQFGGAPAQSSLRIPPQVQAQRDREALEIIQREREKFLAEGNTELAAVNDREIQRLNASIQRLESAGGVTPVSARPAATGGPDMDAMAKQFGGKQVIDTAQPQPYKNRMEALDDAVNLLEEGLDKDKVRAAFEKGGLPWNEIVAHGQKRNSPYFAGQTTTPVASNRLSGDPKAEDSIRPTTEGVVGGTVSAFANAFKRADASLGDVATTYLLETGGIEPDAAARLIARNARQRMAGAPSDTIQQGMQEIADSKTFGQAVTNLASNPRATFTMLVDSVLVSVPALAPSMVVGPAGPLVRGATAAVGSGGLEYGTVMADVLQDKGVDMTNAEAINRALTDPKIMAEIKEKGAKRGLIIGAFDGISMGIAGRFLRPAREMIAAGKLSGQAAKKATMAAWGKELGVQIAGGSGGEATAQAATGEYKPSEIILEGLLDAVTGPMEARSTLRDMKKLERKAAIDAAKVPPADKPADVRVEPTLDLEGEQGEKSTAQVERQAKIDQIAKQLEMSGFPSAEARRLAEIRVPPAETEAELEARLEREAIQSEGQIPVDTLPNDEDIPFDPLPSRDATDSGETQGEADVAGLDTAPTGSSTAVPAQSALDVSAPAGVEAPERAGVVPAGQDASGTAAGEGQRAGAVKGEPPVPEGYVRVYHSGAKGEGDSGRWASTDRKYASGYRDDLPLFYTDIPADDPRVNNPDIPEQGVRQGFTFNFELTPAEAATLKETPRGTETPETQQTETQGQEAAAPAAPAGVKTAEQLEVEIAERKAAAEKAKGFARRAAESAFAEQGSYGSLEESIGANRDNVADTLAEQGVTDPATVTAALEAYDAAVAARETSETPASTTTTEAPKKRGRPAVLTPEQKAEKAAETKADRAQREKHRRALGRLVPALEKANTPLNEDDFANDEALKEAQDEQRAARKEAARALVQISEEAGAKPAGKEARAALKQAGVTEREIADIKRGLEATRNAQSTVSPAMSGNAQANPAFSNAANAVQSLGVVLKGAASEALKRIARRLRSFNAGVKFQVIEQGDELPDVLKRHLDDWNAARGIFIQNEATGERMIFVKGASFGVDQGANDITVVHENLHAATNQRLYLGLTALENGFSLNSPMVRAAKDIVDIMREAQNRYFELQARGRVPAAVARLVASTDADILGDPKEFLAYGLSDPDFQQFLMNTRGKQVETSFFTRFVDSVRRLLGMAEDETNALSDLIKATDDLLSARKTPLMRVLEQGDRRLAQLSEKNAEKVSAQSGQPGQPGKKSKANRTEAELAADVVAAKQNVQRSRLGTEAQAKGLNVLQALRSPKAAKQLLKDAWDSATYAQRQLLVKIPTLDVLAEWAKEAGVPRIADVQRHMQEMNGMTTKFLEGAQRVVSATRDVFKALPQERKALENLVYESTLAEYDPSNPNNPVRNKTLDQDYKQLSPASQNLYKLLRDYYADIHDLFRLLLDDQVENLKDVSAEIKQNLMVMIRQSFEKGGRIQPFFPLVRRGDFWVSVGRGENRRFYMFESQAKRNAFAKTLKGDVKMGNDVGELRRATQDSSQMLKAFFDAIDKQDLADPNVKEGLKDSVYQIYLQTMPEQSFRNMFIHRKGVSGFSTDLVRNTATTASRMATQLARLKFAPILRNDLSAARDSIEGRPELTPFVQETQRRIASALSGQPSGIMDAIAGAANKLSYIWYMSSAASALLQPFSIFISGLPVIAANHGGNWLGAARELGKMMTYLNQYGVTRENLDGSLSLSAPSITNNRNLSQDERDAVNAMMERGVEESTYASAVWGYSRVPSADIDSVAGKGKRAADILVGGLMHNTERLTREAVYLASYRLGKRRGLSSEEAINQAVADTNEALSDYDISNRPRWMQKGLGKIAFQFKMYPLHMTLLLLTSFKKMLPLLNKEGKAAAAQKFFGIMGMSGLLAGTSGMAFFSPVMGLVGWAWKQMQDDDDLPEELKDKDFETWFRAVFLPEHFAQPWADILDRGILNYATGLDFSSRIGLNDLWGRDMKEMKSARDSFTAWVVDNFGGPTASLGLNMIDAYEAFAMGDYQKAVEKASPALVRNMIVANKYADEGAQTYRGSELVPKEALTNGELFGQAIGFRPDRVAFAQAQAFKLSGVEQKVLNQRDFIMRKLTTAHKRGSDDAFQNVLDKDVAEFNRKNPENAIEADDIYNSVLKQAELRSSARAGVNLTEKNARLVRDAVDNLEKTLEKPIPQK